MMNILSHACVAVLREMLAEVEEESHSAQDTHELACLLLQKQAIENELASRVQ